jgi:hypothetical protein
MRAYTLKCDHVIVFYTVLDMLFYTCDIIFFSSFNLQSDSTVSMLVCAQFTNYLFYNPRDVRGSTSINVFLSSLNLVANFYRVFGFREVCMT